MVNGQYKSIKYLIIVYMNNTDRTKRLQDKIDETKKRIDSIDQDIDKTKQELLKIEKQLTWCRLMQRDNESINITDRQEKKRLHLSSLFSIKTKEESKIIEIEDLLIYMKDDPKRAERLFGHLLRYVSNASSSVKICEQTRGHL